MRHRLALAAPAIAILLLASPAAAESTYVGGVEGMLGFPGSFDFNSENITLEGDTNASFGLVPWIEQKLGDVVGFGGEVMFVWMQPEGAKERRMVLSPHLRARMAFPIIDKVTFDAFIAGGLSMWMPVDDGAGGTDDFRLGWSMRFGFGGSYAINETVSAYGHLGWYTTTTFGDDITANMHTVPLCVGLRGNF